MSESNEMRLLMLERDNEQIKEAVSSIKESTRDISESLKTLTRLETRHEETRHGLTRAFKSLEKHDERLRAIEYEMPPLKETRGWVVKAIIGVCVAFGMALTGVVFGT